jgi:hypothetical protein
MSRAVVLFPLDLGAPLVRGAPDYPERIVEHCHATRA